MLVKFLNIFYRNKLLKIGKIERQFKPNSIIAGWITTNV